MSDGTSVATSVWGPNDPHYACYGAEDCGWIVNTAIGMFDLPCKNIADVYAMCKHVTPQGLHVY